jgi:hypothetical protein
MGLELRLWRDELEAQAAPRAGLGTPAVRAFYVLSGALRLTAEGASATLGANSAWHSPGPPQVAAGHLATTALRWELVPAGAPDTSLTSEGIRSTRLLAARMALDAAQPWLLRCDRVDFPPRGEALPHTHRGGGIRCLIAGAIEIETKGARHAYRPLEAWFEAGPDPVYAAASATEASAFVRVMILPRALLGKSSIHYVNSEDLAKPKSQRYQVFVDAPVELPQG